MIGTAPPNGRSHRAPKITPRGRESRTAASLAAEPMTCPSGAFDCGTRQVRLGAGHDHATRIRIAGIDASGSEEGV